MTMELHSIIDILKTGPDTTGLKLGDLLRVKVLAVEEGIGRALVEIGRLRASAELRFPVNRRSLPPRSARGCRTVGPAPGAEGLPRPHPMPSLGR